MTWKTIVSVCNGGFVMLVSWREVDLNIGKTRFFYIPFLVFRFSVCTLECNVQSYSFLEEATFACTLVMFKSRKLSKVIYFFCLQLPWIIVDVAPLRSPESDEWQEYWRDCSWNKISSELFSASEDSRINVLDMFRIYKMTGMDSRLVPRLGLIRDQVHDRN